MKIGIVIGSTRQGRATDKVAAWVAAAAKGISGAEVILLDLRDYPMPFFDEPMSPQSNKNRSPAPEVKKWLDALARCDRLVFVTPEYNHAMPAVLKNALDYVDLQLKDKKALIVGHGPSSGASDAIANLQTVLGSSIGMNVVESSVSLHTVVAGGGVFDEDGTLIATGNEWSRELRAALHSLT